MMVPGLLVGTYLPLFAVLVAWYIRFVLVLAAVTGYRLLWRELAARAS